MSRSVLLLRPTGAGATANAAVPLEFLYGDDSGETNVTTMHFARGLSAVTVQKCKTTLSDASFDAVVAAGLGEDKQRGVFAELLRALKPGATLLTVYEVSEKSAAAIEESVTADLIMGGFVGAKKTVATVRTTEAVSVTMSFAASKPVRHLGTGLQTCHNTWAPRSR